MTNACCECATKLFASPPLWFLKALYNTLKSVFKRFNRFSITSQCSSMDKHLNGNILKIEAAYTPFAILCRVCDTENFAQSKYIFVAVVGFSLFIYFLLQLRFLCKSVKCAVFGVWWHMYRYFNIGFFVFFFYCFGSWVLRVNFML